MCNMETADTVWRALGRLDGAPEMKYNPKYERVFIACLAVERARPAHVIHNDRYMNMFEFCQRWGQIMWLEMEHDLSLCVADVAGWSAYEAGLDSSYPSDYLGVATAIMVKSWDHGDELLEWAKGAGCCRHFNALRPVFPLQYLWEPAA